MEAVCAFARRQRKGGLSPQQHSRTLIAFDYDVQNRYNVLAVEPVVIDTARRLANQYPLRAYDFGDVIVDRDATAREQVLEL